MHKTLRLSFSLQNTYRVNSILYSLKQVPVLKRILPDALYQVRGLKDPGQHPFRYLGSCLHFFGKVPVFCRDGLRYRGMV